MNFKDAVTLYFQRSDAMQTYWGFYITVVLGLIAFVGSVKSPSRLTALVLFLSIAFCGFALVNLGGLYSVAKQRIASRDIAVDLSAHEPENGRNARDAIIRTMTPPAESGVIVVHVLGDVLTLAALWWLAAQSTRRRSSG